MNTDHEVSVTIAKTAKQFADAPTDTDSLLHAGLAQLSKQGLNETEAKAVLRFAILGSSPDFCLKRWHGQESEGDALTLKDLSLVRILC